MIWYHGIPDSSVVLLLVLLFFSPFGPLKGCKFDYSPIATSDFSQDIKPLKEYLLLDYKVSMPFSLKQDNSSVSFALTNISQFVDVIPFHLQSLSAKIEKITSEEKCADFKNCTVIQSQIAGI